jgi:NADPH:quinone reductase-like Zn-dependent oxidoreductase
MFAFQFKSYDPNEVLTIEEDIKEPEIKPNQVLVEVYAAGLNPVDKSIMAGYLKEMVHLPATVGGDFAGIVVQVGDEVIDFQRGDSVYGQAIILNGGSGTLAQFAAANAGNTAIQPKGISFEQAASLPLAGVSALQALEVHMKLKAGQKILIHGGAGGIGSIAVQIAKSIGAYTATTVSTNDVEFAKKLGADKVIDFSKENFEEILEDYDAVFVTPAGDIVNKSFSILKPGSILVSMLSAPDAVLAKKHDVTAIHQMTNTDTQKLNLLADLVNERKVIPQVAKVFPKDHITEAFKYLGEGHPKGKIVIRIKH